MYNVRIPLLDYLACWVVKYYVFRLRYPIFIRRIIIEILG